MVLACHDNGLPPQQRKMDYEYFRVFYTAYLSHSGLQYIDFLWCGNEAEPKAMMWLQIPPKPHPTNTTWLEDTNFFCMIYNSRLSLMNMDGTLVLASMQY